MRPNPQIPFLCSGRYCDMKPLQSDVVLSSTLLYLYLYSQARSVHRPQAIYPGTDRKNSYLCIIIIWFQS